MADTSASLGPQGSQAEAARGAARGPASAARAPRQAGPRCRLSNGARSGDARGGSPHVPCARGGSDEFSPAHGGLCMPVWAMRGKLGADSYGRGRLQMWAGRLLANHAGHLILLCPIFLYPSLGMPGRAGVL